MNSPPAKRKILVIDDDPALRGMLQRYITIQGFDPVLAASGAEGLKMLEMMTPDLILLDISMPEMDGMVILRTLHEKYDQLRVIMMAVGSDVPKAMAALNYGASDYIAKPVDLSALKQMLQIHFAGR